MSICIIPARGGSRRIPNKNIRPFFGKPMIAYAIEKAEQAGYKVVVSTDDEGIGKIAERYGAIRHHRSPQMARDEVGTQEVAGYVLDSLGVKRQAQIVVLYPCTPLVTVRDLSTLPWQDIEDRKGFGMAVGAKPLRDAGAFYCGWAYMFTDLNPLIDGDTSLIVLPEERVCDINTESDWRDAEAKYRALYPNTFATTE